MLSPDIGIAEMLLVAAVALIVVGPKDLPLMMRKVGQFIARLRGMASEFRASFEDMARQSELEDLRREVEAMRSGKLPESLKDTVGSDPSVDQVFADIESGMRGGEVTIAPPMAYSPPADSDPEPEPAPKPARKARAKPASDEAPAKTPRKAAAKAPAKAAPKADIVNPPKRGRAKGGIVT